MADSFTNSTNTVLNADFDGSLSGEIQFQIGGTTVVVIDNDGKAIFNNEVTVSSHAIISGNVDLSNGDYGIKVNIGCFVYLSGNQSIDSGGAVKLITFDTEKYDFGNDFDVANSSFTCPVNGYYEMYAITQYTDFADDAEQWIKIYKNGAAMTPEAWSRTTTSGGGNEDSSQVYYIEDCNAGDQITAMTYHDSGIAKDLIAQATYMIIGLKYAK